MSKLFKILGVVLLVVVVAIAGLLIYVKTALPKVAAAQDMKVELTPERIKRGAYLANNVSLCIDCHSERDYSLWSGPVKPGTLGRGGEGFTREQGFPGNFYARNISPTGLSSWTDGEIYRAITTGVNKDGKALFPIMQWPHYGKMDPEDIKAVIAYLRSLPPQDNVPPESEADFPMNFIINTMPTEATPTKRPDPSNVLAYGEYLVNAAVCTECHTKSEKGELVGEPFSGGFEFGFPEGMLRSANITPDPETGIGLWSEAAFISKFKSYTDSGYQPHKIAPGQMQTVMPWMLYGGMDSTDLKAIYAYLRTVKPVKNEIVRWEPATVAAK